MPQIRYSASELFDHLHIFDHSNGTPDEIFNTSTDIGEYYTRGNRFYKKKPFGHNVVTMVNGYLMVVYARDSGGHGGGILFYDLGNPRSPKLVGHLRNKYTNRFREVHSVPLLVRNGTVYGAINTAWGIQFWNFTKVTEQIDKSKDLNALALHELSSKGLSTHYNHYDIKANLDAEVGFVADITLPGVNSGDYTKAAWQTSWSGGMLYVSGTDLGLFVIDTRNPEAPYLLSHTTINKLGNFILGPLYAVGDRLYMTTQREGVAKFSVVDISNPEAPSLIKTSKIEHPLFSDANSTIYSSTVYGKFLLVAKRITRTKSNLNRGGLTVYEIVNDGLKLKSSQLRWNDAGIYIKAQDDRIHFGAKDYYRLFSLDDDSGETKPIKTYSLPFGPNKARGNRKSDITMEQIIPLGNLVFIGSDHGNGSPLVVHQTEPDTEAPYIINSRPIANEEVPAAATIGITFSDHIDHRTLSNENLILRRLSTGSTVMCQFGYCDNVVNITPLSPLTEGVHYELEIVKSGVSDVAGNGFSESITIPFKVKGDFKPLTVVADMDIVNTSGERIAFAGHAAGGSGQYKYSWELGDGNVLPGKNITYSYSAPGHYSVVLRVEDAEENVTTYSRQILVHRPLSEKPSVNSSSIIYDAELERAYVVNPDNDSLTAIDCTENQVLWESSTGTTPLTVALLDGSLWVNCLEADTIQRFDMNGVLKSSVSLAYGSRPRALIANTHESALYVSLEGKRKIVKINSVSQQIVVEYELDFQPYSLALNNDRLITSRLVSKGQKGLVAKVNLLSGEVTPIYLEAETDNADTTFSGRGVPNYLQSVTINPDGKNVWVTAKKDNVFRGLKRDGQNLNFENTVRAITAVIDLDSSSEIFGLRRDHNDSSLTNAVSFSPYGNLAFVALRGSNKVRVIDSYTGSMITDIRTGLTPLGLAVDGEKGILLVHNYLERQVEIFDISKILSMLDTDAVSIARLRTVISEKLDAEVLKGKQIFNNADDLRMTKDNYLTCSSCHLDGGQDGMVWDFSNNEGFRNTITLLGRRGTGHGPVHWTANFNEIHDFENDIRNNFDGGGFLTDDEFSSTEDTFGEDKAGLSKDLDALAAYVTSLVNYPKSPYRATDGSYTADALEGEKLFQSLNCASCHSGNDFTDSTTFKRHDIGTQTTDSGKRLGAELDGFDTPTLKGVWNTAPYFHDGSAETLRAVIDRSGPRHGNMKNLSDLEKKYLEAYLLQLDGNSSNIDLDAGAQGLLREYWLNIGGSHLSKLTGNPRYPDSPDGSDILTSAESVSWENPLLTQKFASNYGQRIRGYLTAPVSGDYRFWISGDDYCSLRLGEDAASAPEIAKINGWSSYRQWNRFPSQSSAVIYLKAGQKYYLEALHKEGGGGDHLSIGWLKPGESGNVPSEVIPGVYLNAYSVGRSPEMTSYMLNYMATAGGSLRGNISQRVAGGGEGTAVTAVANSDSVFIGWSDGLESVTRTDVILTADLSITAQFQLRPSVRGLLRQYWLNISGSNLSKLTSNPRYPDSPDGSDILTSAESVSWENPLQTQKFASNYGQRIRGYLTAPVSGNYRFWISGDDYCSLRLGTDAVSAPEIAKINGWSSYRQWNRFPSQASAVIYLKAGQKYYLEALHKEGGGGDHLSIGWLKPGESGNVPSGVIPGVFLTPFAGYETSTTTTGISLNDNVSQTMDAGKVQDLTVGLTQLRYRLYHPESGFHHWTTDFYEYQTLESLGWNHEGPSCWIYMTAVKIDDQIASKYERLYNPVSGQHHWTSEAVEIAAMLELGWITEASSEHIFEKQTSGAIPLYRMYNPFNRSHHWTIDPQEYHALEIIGWVKEGISGYLSGE